MVPAEGPNASDLTLTPRIRRAQPSDFSPSSEDADLIALVPPALAEAVCNGTASTALDAAEAGTYRFHKALAAAHTRGFTAAMNSVSTVLVATDDDGESALLIAEPAVRAFGRSETFSGLAQLERLTLVFAAEITTITAHGLSPAGSALLHTADDLYSQAGYALLYGTSSAEEAPYGPKPFRTAGPGSALCLDQAFLGRSIGLAVVAPEPGTLIYYADLQGQAQADWEYPVAADDGLSPAFGVTGAVTGGATNGKGPGAHTRRAPGPAFG